uniref:Uncharacterized protein n=1 Tax=Alexandrium monilatum TaxID=311494 RepID=A0A6T1BHQ0_9DINO
MAQALSAIDATLHSQGFSAPSSRRVAMSANKRYSKAEMARAKQMMEEYQERAKTYSAMTAASYKKTHFNNIPEHAGRNYWQPSLRYTMANIVEVERTGIQVSQLNFHPQVQWTDTTYRGD